MASTVVGFFDSKEDAQDAVDQLVNNGFSRSDIDVSSGNSANTSDSLTTSNTENVHEEESGISRFFRNLFGSDDDDAKRYSAVGNKSGAIVTVHTQSSDDAEKAADLLDDNGAVDVNEKASEYGYSSGSTFGNMDAGTDYTTNPGMPVGNFTTAADDTMPATMGTTTTGTATTGNSSTDNDMVVPIIQEDLQVGKRTVQTGGVRVRSRIVERPVEESIRLREEQVRVERTPVNRVMTDADMASFQDKNIELTETAEVPVVSKQARVVEEIRVSKDATERDETVKDSVRNTEVDIEDLSKNDSGNSSTYNTGSNT